MMEFQPPQRAVITSHRIPSQQPYLFIKLSSQLLSTKHPLSMRTMVASLIIKLARRNTVARSGVLCAIASSGNLKCIAGTRQAGVRVLVVDVGVGTRHGDITTILLIATEAKTEVLTTDVVDAGDMYVEENSRESGNADFI